MILITGGARSGKSSQAEELAKHYGGNILYVATAKAFDEGMKERIKKHRERRPKTWATLEQYRGFSLLPQQKDFCDAHVILLDCVTLMITNLMLDENIDYDKISMTEMNGLEEKIKREVQSLVDVCKVHQKKFIAVTNEVGMGLVPSYMMGNIFRDISGRINQLLAKESDCVIFMVSGLPLYVKGGLA